MINKIKAKTEPYSLRYGQQRRPYVVRSIGRFLLPLLEQSDHPSRWTPQSPSPHSSRLSAGPPPASLRSSISAPSPLSVGGSPRGTAHGGDRRGGKVAWGLAERESGCSTGKAESGKWEIGIRTCPPGLRAAWPCQYVTLALRAEMLDNFI